MNTCLIIINPQFSLDNKKRRCYRKSINLNIDNDLLISMRYQRHHLTMTSDLIKKRLMNQQFYIIKLINIPVN
jgi:hypothetical protein